MRISLTEQGRALKARTLHVPDCIEAALGMDMADVIQIRDGVAQIRSRLLKRKK